MIYNDLISQNEIAISKLSEFRANAHPDQFGLIDDLFHKYKNSFPYFGHVPVIVDDIEVTMYCGNDDLVVLTYFWHGPNSYESGSLDTWLRCARNADKVFDIGSFSGLYSLIAASAQNSAKVYAFEPSRRTHGRLLLNSYINRLQDRIECENFAVSNEQTELRLMQFRGSNILGNGAAIVEKAVPVTDATEIVNVIKIDDYCSTNGVMPDLLKVDVEGAEVLALEGMSDLIATNRPTMLVEVTPETAKAVIETLKKFNYSIRKINDRERKLERVDRTINSVTNLFAEKKGH